MSSPIRAKVFAYQEQERNMFELYLLLNPYSSFQEEDFVYSFQKFKNTVLKSHTLHNIHTQEIKPEHLVMTAIYIIK